MKGNQHRCMRGKHVQKGARINTMKNTQEDT